MADPPLDGAANRALPWQTCLDVENQAPGHYPDVVNTGVFEAIAGTPRRVLELGCAAGALGAELKSRYPGASVVGIEAGRAPAALAATRLDRVIRARIEEIDFAAEGLVPGEFDTVVAADILEHLVNPWDVLVRMKPFLAPNAQVVASIPNIRNLLLIGALAVNGRWEYRDHGLLDITHLRFFTLEEIRRLFHETGYRYEHHLMNLAAPLVDFYHRYAGHEKISIEMGRLKLSDVTPEELMELCAGQFFVRARLA